MPKSTGREMIVGHFDHKLRRERLPLARTLRAPATRTAWRSAGEAGRANVPFQLLRHRRLRLGGDVRCEADMVQQTFVVVEAEKQRADLTAIRAVAKPADDAIDGADLLDLDHRRAIAGAVGAVETLGDDAVEVAADLAKPASCLGQLRRRRRQADGAARREVLLCERLQQRPTLGEGKVEQALPLFVREQIERDVQGRVGRR